jgi:hypothetical protein
MVASVGSVTFESPARFLEHFQNEKRLAVPAGGRLIIQGITEINQIDQIGKGALEYRRTVNALLALIGRKCLFHKARHTEAFDCSLTEREISIGCPSGFQIITSNGIEVRLRHLFKLMIAFRIHEVVLPRQVWIRCLGSLWLGRPTYHTFIDWLNSEAPEGYVATSNRSRNLRALMNCSENPEAKVNLFIREGGITIGLRESNI